MPPIPTILHLSIFRNILRAEKKCKAVWQKALKFSMLLCLPQADICWNVVVKQFTGSEIRGKYIAFSHIKINAYNCFVQKL